MLSLDKVAIAPKVETVLYGYRQAVTLGAIWLQDALTTGCFSETLNKL
jgi:hypothetical protein